MAATNSAAIWFQQQAYPQYTATSATSTTGISSGTYFTGKGQTIGADCSIRIGEEELNEEDFKILRSIINAFKGTKNKDYVGKDLDQAIKEAVKALKGGL